MVVSCAVAVAAALVWAGAPRTEAQRGRRHRGPVAFMAASGLPQTIRGNTKIAFNVMAPGGRGWSTRESKFTAPVDGVYGFDLGVRINHVAPALSCKYTFSLVHHHRGEVLRSYEMLILEQSTVDVGDSGRRDPVLRQTAWRLRDAASVHTQMSRGDTLEVHAKPSHQLCDGQARIAPAEEDMVVTYLSGYKL